MARYAFFVVAAAMAALTSADELNSHQLHATHVHYDVPDQLVMDMEPQESGGAGLGGHVVRTVLMLCIFVGMLSAFVSPHMGTVESIPTVESTTENNYELEGIPFDDELAVEACVSQDENIILKAVEDPVVPQEEPLVSKEEHEPTAPNEQERAQKRAALLERAALILKDRRTRSYDDIHGSLDASTFAIVPGAKHAPARFTQDIPDIDEVPILKDAPLLSHPNANSKLSAAAAPYVSTATPTAAPAAPFKSLLDSTGAPTPEFLRSVPPKAPSPASAMMMFMPLMMTAGAGMMSPNKRNIRQAKRKNKNNNKNKQGAPQPGLLPSPSFNMQRNMQVPDFPRAASLPMKMPAACVGGPSLLRRAPSAVTPSIWSTASASIQSKVGRVPPGLSDPFMNQQPLLPTGLLM